MRKTLAYPAPFWYNILTPIYHPHPLKRDAYRQASFFIAFESGSWYHSFGRNKFIIIYRLGASAVAGTAGNLPIHLCICFRRERAL